VTALAAAELAGSEKGLGTPTLAARGIVKRFGPLVAVDHADIDIRPGIHALLGETGAGKSTLVKVLYGYLRPDEGLIEVGGRPVRVDSPADARRLGIGLVFQQFTLIPALTVTENVALHLPDLPRVLQPNRIAQLIDETGDRYDLDVDPGRRVGTLSLPEQQRVEILRVLLSGARVVVLDEPTSALPAQEIDALFHVLRRLRDDGYPVVLITHKLPEVFAVADTVTVMRRGAVVETCPIEAVDEDRLVRLMFGETPPAPRREDHVGAADRKAEPALELRGVTSAGQGRPLFGLDLSIRPGEIVGVAGVAGNGQRELCDTITGLARIKAGERLLGGVDATRWSVRRLRHAGVGYVPERAIDHELLWNLTLAENVALGSPDRFSRLHGFGLDWRGVRESWNSDFAALDLHLPEADQRAGTLSGGNAQRFAVARELVRRPRLLVLLHPTRGLDVPTAAAVQRLLLQARERGCGILLVSQDLGELTALSDRLLVMRDGHLVAEVDPHETDAYELGALMTGSGSEATP
jgi:ABC-type uncharacterized transport system ATPase subunit